VAGAAVGGAGGGDADLATIVDPDRGGVAAPGASIRVYRPRSSMKLRSLGVESR
jgi:hypothetical protein